MTPLSSSRLSTEQLRALDKQHIWHPFTPMKLWSESDPLVITDAKGFELIDSDGRRYLDGVSSLWCNVHGHRVPEIDRAIRDQLDRFAHSTMLGLANEPSIVLADRLLKIVPHGLTKVFYSDSGATATEIAFKLAAQYWFNIGRPEKNEFVGFTEAYHGDTVGAMSIGRMPAFHRAYFPMMFKAHFAPTPHVYRPPNGMQHGLPGAACGLQPARRGGNVRAEAHTPRAIFDDARAVTEYCLHELKNLLQNHASSVAAICIEPIVQGAGGMIVQPEGFLRGVRELASRHDVLLICDEVATGFGRTGKMFSCEHENVSPDLMCAAKGITGGYLPLAATFATEKIYDAFLGDPSEGKTFYHGHTYTGNALACAAAIASLDLFEKNRLVKEVASKSEKLTTMLKELSDLPYVGEIRQKGFMVGIELVKDKKTREPFDPKLRVGAEVCQRIREHGVILRPLGDVIVLMPPLAMPLADLRRIVNAVIIEIGKI